MSYLQTQAPPNSHLYPQALQLKLYQAFIFSIPILFSIILFLLFYLFYLKRRFSSPSSPPPILPRTFNVQPIPSMNNQMRLKANIKDKLSVILFDDDLKARDSQCCVCLGEFELKEELQQIPLCKHLFHSHCIFHWLHSNATCPLCRCIIHIAKHPNSDPLVIPDPIIQDGPNPQMVSANLEEQINVVNTNLNSNCSIGEHVVIQVEGSSSTST